MKRLHLFEFMDLPWLPESLRATVREVLEICLGEPPRQFYAWVIGEIHAIVQREGIRTVMELGAGTAPLARRLAPLVRRLAKNVSSQQRLRIEVSDLYPHKQWFSELEQEFPDIVTAKYEPVDFTKRFEPRPQTLLVLSGAFHHVPPTQREEAVKSLSEHRVAVFEPMPHRFLAALLALGGCVPALIAPLHYLKAKSGHLRRIFWCWLVPFAPLIIVWDGVVSCLRTWNDEQWKQTFRSAAPSLRLQIKHDGLRQMVDWSE